jgi:hypothetical protein
MDTLSAVQAAHYLGITERGLRKQITRGELTVLSVDPIRLDAGHVDAVLRMRQTDALRDLVRQQKTAVSLARETLTVLYPRDAGTRLPADVAARQRLGLSLVDDRAKVLFGTAALSAALVDDGSCRWCTSAAFARVLRTWAPTSFSEGYKALFGGQLPCEVCGPGLYGSVMAALAAQVHPPGSGPSKPHRPPSEAERQAAREWVARHAPAPATPMQGDDDGRALVSLRLRQTRERLKAAKRSGDQAYAIRLTQTLKSLTADASAIDGRAAAAARPGMLACGHALAAGCSCPRRATKRSSR